MSELEHLSEISNDDLEQQIDNSDDEIVLKEKNESDDEDDDVPPPPDQNESDEESDEEIDKIEDDDQNDDQNDELEDDNQDDDDQEENNKQEKSQPLSLINNYEENNSDYYSSDSDEDNDYNNEFKKIDQDTKQDYLLQYHQETKIHNFDEILSLCKILRNNKNIIIDELHKTIPHLTKYEKTKILGERTKQINSGSKPFVEVSNDIIDGYLIAIKELEEKRIPFIIRRPMPSGGSEYWHLKDLEII